jgi:hypothetical protein
MIAAVLVLSLISLLVATDHEQEGPSFQPNPDPPLRPNRKAEIKEVAESDQLAA